jgi:DNA-binding PadR family transcriptional regulator
MKGFLSFLVLWLLSKESMTGSELADELEKRKGSRPSPGTIYPVLKYLKAKNLIEDKDKKYFLTDKGKNDLEQHLNTFYHTFYDINEMKGIKKRK